MNSIRESQQGFCVVDDVYVKWHLGDPSLPLVFTFAGAEEGDPRSILSEEDAKRGISPWAFETIRTLGCNVVSFASVSKPCWYRSVALHSFMHEVNLATYGYANRLGYGVSMGGFGASAFSNILNIKRLLLFYPIPTKNTLIAPFIGDKEDAVLRYDWNFGCIDGATSLSSGVIFYDPFFRRDAEGVKRFSGSFERIRCPGLKHGFAGKLVESGLLKEIVSSFVRDNLDASLIRKRVKQISRCYSSYYTNLISMVSSRKASVFLDGINNDLSKAVESKDIGAISFLLESDKEYEAITLSTLMGKPIELAYIFRDRAIELEKINILRSLLLMGYAKKILPGGPVINAKIEEYNLKLKEKEFKDTM